MPRSGKESRKRNIIAAAIAIPMIVLVAYQAISNIIHGRTGGENYLWQPVGPGLQLSVLVVIAVVGAVSGWRYLFGKPIDKDKEKKINRSRKISILRETKDV